MAAVLVPAPHGPLKAQAGCSEVRVQARRPMRILRIGLGKTPGACSYTTLHRRSCTVAESARTMRSLWPVRAAPSMAASASITARSGLKPWTGLRCLLLAHCRHRSPSRSAASWSPGRGLATVHPGPAQKSTPPREGGRPRPRSPAYGGIDR